jgi:hypothetical protein
MHDYVLRLPEDVFGILFSRVILPDLKQNVDFRAM